MARPQWNLLHFFGFMAVAALGAAAWRRPGGDFWDGFIAMLLAIMALGLIYQAADLCVALAQRDLPRGALSVGLLEVAWRLGAAALLLVGGNMQPAESHSGWSWFLFEWRDP